MKLGPQTICIFGNDGMIYEFRPTAEKHLAAYLEYRRMNDLPGRPYYAEWSPWALLQFSFSRQLDQFVAEFTRVARVLCE